MTALHVLEWCAAGVFIAAVVIALAVRLIPQRPSRPKRRHSLSDLLDPERDDIDPDWPGTRKTMRTDDEEHL